MPRLHGGEAPPAIALSLEDLRRGVMSSSPLSGPNLRTYGVSFIIVSQFPSIVSFL